MLDVKISVRNLIESVLRTGDIDDSYRSATRMLEGTLAHQKVQKSYGKEYKSEVSLKTNIEYENFNLKIDGRADGIFTNKDSIIIEEIKSTTVDLVNIKEDFNELHWAQVKFYGYIYMRENDLNEIDLKLTYFHLEEETTREFFKHFAFKELEKFCIEIIGMYVEWANTTFYWIEDRDKSLRELKFPFGSYRNGQRELAVSVYKTIEENKNIFLQAPTGIGKTMSTLFPTLKTMGKGFTEKVFYLTAKTITRQAPLKAYDILKGQGIQIKTLVITSKEKICMNEQVKCNPKDCPYAKGHFDRVNDAIRDIFDNEDLFTRENIEDYAEKHKVCPFEFSLDLSNFADLIICDYNYLFDPKVMLRRFFEINKTEFVFLIDEAHNLVDRARSMYTTGIIDKNINDLIKGFEDNRAIYNGLNKLLDTIDIIRIKYNVKDEFYQEEYIDELSGVINRVITNLDKYLVDNKDDENYEKVLELYFDLLNYRKISDYYDEHFYTSIEYKDNVTEIKINCIDPSYLIRKSLNKGRSGILFSATLSPMEYYIDILGGNGKDYHMTLPSPFPRENLSVSMVTNVSTKFKNREYTYKNIVEYIKSFIDGKDGNYMIFFPSYKYMEDIFDIIMETENNRKYEYIIQDRIMNEMERELFLKEFDKDNIVAFVVMGGIFSEGIDLVGDKLIGGIVVGVGLPMISFENNMIKNYYDNYLGSGFDYAYTYPGMNKVLQASGRVIRTEKDKGSILLIDDRYGYEKYKELFPQSWGGYYQIKNIFQLDYVLKNFWN